METLAVADILTEDDLQRSVIKTARALGWLVYATYRSKRSEPGFPDLVCVRGPRVLFIENKTMTEKLRKGKWNKASTRWLPGQDDWKRELEACPGVEYYLWRPSDLDKLVAVLQ